MLHTSKVPVCLCCVYCYYSAVCVCVLQFDLGNAQRENVKLAGELRNARGAAASLQGLRSENQELRRALEEKKENTEIQVRGGGGGGRREGEGTADCRHLYLTNKTSTIVFPLLYMGVKKWHPAHVRLLCICVFRMCIRLEDGFI